MRPFLIVSGLLAAVTGVALLLNARGWRCCPTAPPGGVGQRRARAALRTIVLIWLAWAVGLIGFQSLAVYRFQMWAG
ncbi:MAG TPA: hypothetical protein ENN19_15950 [Chloroflexi bacterium]|nr:hypothetical protein [Chloroflexota bacterium]